MSTQIQRRRGTTAEHSTFTGVEGELTVDTTKDTVVVHDGATTGGRPLLREDGTNSALALGSAATPSLKFAADTNTGIYSPGADQVAISTNGTGRIYIDPNGKIGFNQSSPGSFTTGANNFVLSANDNVGMTIASLSSGLSNIYFADGTTGSEPYRGFVSYNHSTDYLQFGTSGTERLRITSDGKLGLGTSTPNVNYKMTIEGNSAGVGPAIAFSDTVASPNNYVIGINGSKNFFIDGPSAASFDFVLDSSGRVGIGSTNPGTRLHVANAGDTPVFIENTSSADTYVYLKNNAGGAGIASRTNDLSFHTSAALTERVRITSDGKLGLGTSAPSEALHVVSTAGEIVYAESNRNTNGQYVGGLITAARNSSGNSVPYAGIYGSITSNTATTESGALTFWTRSSGSSSERARIDSSGRLLVGTSTAGSTYRIGTTSFTPKVQAEGTDVSPLAIQRTDGPPHLFIATGVNVASGSDIGKISFNAKDGTNLVQAATIGAECDGTPGSNDMPGRLVFSTTADGASSPTESMRINSAQEILAGTTSSWFNRKFIIEATNHPLALINTTQNDYPLSILNTATSGNNIFAGFWTEGRGTPTLRGSIDYNRPAGQVRYNVTSDRRLKSNIQDSDTALSVLDQIKVRSYTWTETGYGVAHGFIAQELSDVVPDAVKVGDESDEVVDTWAVDNSKLVPLLTKALQEAIAEIASLKDRVTALEP